MNEWLEIIKVPLYPGHLCVIICDDFDRCYEIAGIDRDKYHLDMDTDYSDAITFGHPENETRVCIGLKNDVKTGVLVHECVHATNLIFKYTGIEMDLSNDEPYTYLVQWIFEMAQKVTKNHTERIEGKSNLVNAQKELSKAYENRQL